MVTLTRFSHLTSLIYAAALTPNEWSTALTEIHRSLAPAGGGTVRSTGIAFAGTADRQIVGVLKPDASKSYCEHYGRLDHVLAEVVRGPVAALRTGAELMPPDTSTEFFHDWVRPNKLDDGLFVRLTPGPSPACLIVAGPRRSRSVCTAERTRLVRALVPHLQQALRTQHRLATADARAHTFAAMMDRLSYGLILITAELRVVEVNAAASSMLAERDGLRLTDGKLTAARPSNADALRNLAHQALTHDGIRSGGAMKCERTSGKRPYVVHILPLSPATVGTAVHPIAGVLVFDPAREPVPAEDILRQLYGLTRAETAVAALMLNGEGVQAISERLSLSATTVRTHLKAIFAKTGTHRQAELVRLLSMITP